MNAYERTKLEDIASGLSYEEKMIVLKKILEDKGICIEANEIIQNTSVNDK